MDKRDGADDGKREEEDAEAAGDSEGRLATWVQLNVAIDDSVTATFTGYAVDRGKYAAYIVACVLTLGILPLLSYWLPLLWLRLTCSPAAFHEATYVFVKNNYDEIEMCAIVAYEPPTSFGSAAAGRIRGFEYRYIRFFYNMRLGEFEDCGQFCDIFTAPCARPDGTLVALTPDVHATRRTIFGDNLINIREKSIGRLLIDEVLHPFYFFQVFSIVIWGVELYFYYASAIFAISALSIATSLQEMRSNLRNLRHMARYTCTVSVLQSDGEWSDRSSVELVPGDVIRVPVEPHASVPCDCILLRGSCLVNEAMLTGESVPVSKASVTLAPAAVGLQVPAAEREARRHVLYTGTKIVLSRPEGTEPPTALVTRTGFDSAKGRLIRSIIFPRPTSFTFYRDSLRFVAVMGCIALLGFFYSLYNFLQVGAGWEKILLRFLDLITVSVPPALPVAMTIGTSFAIARLKTKGIYCISPPRVNVSGRVGVMAFDKTGTLTEDGLDVVGVCPVDATSQQLTAIQTTMDRCETSFGAPPSATSAGAAPPPPLREVLATAHSLACVHGELVGDPVDTKLVTFSEWVFDVEATAATPSAIAVLRSPFGPRTLRQVRVFDFDSALQRMSAVVWDPIKSTCFVALKGSPEMVASLCEPSTVPPNLNAQLEHYAHQGFRVMAVASKACSDVVSPDAAAAMERPIAESRLTFGALLVLENRLKPETLPALAVLRKANIRAVMVTGDNSLTAASVAKLCGLLAFEAPVYRPLVLPDDLALSQYPGGQPQTMWARVDSPDRHVQLTTAQLVATVGDYWAHRQPVPKRTRSAPPVASEEIPMEAGRDDPRILACTVELAMSGAEFVALRQRLPEDVFRKILLRCQVYARMLPDMKKLLIEELQALDYTTGMCGDGANDCGALRAADMGLSLSAAEASVAAPFSSKVANVSAVLDVIREGRAALVTSFACFKYMAYYAMIQTTTVTILYGIDSNLSDFQFMYIDLILILPLAAAMALTEPYKEIAPKVPTGSLLSPRILISLIAQIFFQAVAQVVLFLVLKQQPWYIPLAANPTANNFACTETTTLFLFSSFLYITGAVVFSLGRPYRRSMFSNYTFVITTLALLGISIYLLFGWDLFTRNFMFLVEIPLLWRVGILVAAAAHALLSLLFERFGMPLILQLLSHLRKRRRRPHKRRLYKRLKDGSPADADAGVDAEDDAGLLAPQPVSSAPPSLVRASDDDPDAANADADATAAARLA